VMRRVPNTSLNLVGESSKDKSLQIDGHHNPSEVNEIGTMSMNEEQKNLFFLDDELS
jgi:hypothetical protein